MSTQKNQNKSEPNISNFDKHLSYFQKLNKERKKTRSRNKKENVFTALPPGMKSQAVSSCLKDLVSNYSIKPAPEYGILKGTEKPTMREWKRLTQKNFVTHTTPPVSLVPSPVSHTTLPASLVTPPVSSTTPNRKTFNSTKRN